jgi:nitrogen-specific signal transduction histidine kinase
LFLQCLRIDDEAALADLFEPFQASDFGHGLELATARRLIENQSGTVRAESIDGHLAYVLELPVSRHAKSVDPLSQLAA